MTMNKIKGLIDAFCCWFAAIHSKRQQKDEKDANKLSDLLDSYFSVSAYTAINWPCNKDTHCKEIKRLISYLRSQKNMHNYMTSTDAPFYFSFFFIQQKNDVQKKKLLCIQITIFIEIEIVRRLFICLVTKRSPL